jgi:hypothetical protein
MPQKQTLSQFGQTIKAKHPEYSDMSDEDVATKVLAKYPEYGDMVDAAPQRGFLGSFADATGISSVKPSDLIGIAAPTEALTKAAGGLLQEGKRVFGEAKAAYNSKDPIEMQKHGTAAVPFIGGAVNTAGQQVDQGNYSGAAGTFAGALANQFGLEFAPKVARVVAPAASAAASAAAEGVGNAASAVKDRIYPTSKSLTPPETAARNLSKALVVPVQAEPNFIPAATAEAGTIKAYAQANNLPINSKVDLGNAAKATAQAVQDHINKNIIGPYADDVVTAPPDYRGTKLNVEGSRATIGQINDRINSIREQLSPNYRHATQLKTNSANVSDAELLAEKRKLVGLVSDKLAERTGLSAEDIEAVQVQAGKLRTIADEVNLSANTDTTAAGKSAMGRSDIPTGTKMGWADRLYQAVRGGPEIIGNRMVNSAFKDISPTELVLPNPRVSPAPPPLANPVQNQGVAPAINGTPMMSVADRVDQLLQRARAAQPTRKGLQR